MSPRERRAALIATSLAGSFVVLRVYLSWAPDSDLYIGPHEIHHLFPGMLLTVFCGLPLMLFHGDNRTLDLAALGCGIGIGMMLDEWVYLIVTDGTNSSYLLPISFLGGLVMVAIVLAYLVMLLKLKLKVRVPEDNRH